MDIPIFILRVAIQQSPALQEYIVNTVINNDILLQNVFEAYSLDKNEITKILTTFDNKIARIKHLREMSRGNKKIQDFCLEICKKEGCLISGELIYNDSIGLGCAKWIVEKLFPQ